MLILLLPAGFYWSNYYMNIFCLVLMWVVIGCSWNLLAGFTGQVSFGHAVFFGVGAYSAGVLQLHLAISPWWGLLIAGFVAMTVGFLVGVICFRLRGPYFALGTIAVGEMVRHLALYFHDFTGGNLGITVAQDYKIADKTPYFYVIAGIALLCFYTIRFVMRSKWGFYFVAVREDQDAAESMGISTFKYKSLSLMLSSFFTGMAGAFALLFLGYIDPEVVFSLHFISIMAILVAIIGGVGTQWGPVVGAFIMVGVQETFRSGWFGLADDMFGDAFAATIKGAHAFVFGILVVIVILFLANGVVGDWGKLTGIVRPKKAEKGGA
ncbi:MAG: branched-chain amino acid ABC transporter permease [Desulfovibrio sp.]|nr:MAG: branched-chain amino acid ABC transporter permease [Desulfovibrio sp.]